MSNTSNLPVRQITKAGAVVKNGKQSAPQFANEIETAWQLYRDQLQRNFELMKIISELQNVIGMSANGSVQQLQPVKQEEIKPELTSAEMFADLKSLSLQRSRQLELIYRQIDRETKRIDAVQNYLEMLHAIYQLEEVYPDRLFMQVVIPDSSGYRYIRFLQKLGLIKYRKTKITLSNAGLILMQSPLENGKQSIELIQKLKAEGIKFGLCAETVAIWFDERAEKQ